MSRFIDLTGQRFGRLTVIERAENDRRGQVRWRCACDCGGASITYGVSLRSGDTRSCGCLAAEVTSKRSKKHGFRHHPIYYTWRGMRERCYKETSKDYSQYGGRGINVCDGWMHDANAFITWSLAHGWAPGLSLDRVNNNGPYAPDNCRWITAKEQNRNRRDNIKVTFNGVERLVCALIEESGLPKSTVKSRRQRGWSWERALTEPSRGRPSRLHVAST